MNITVFTSNQARHLALLERLSSGGHSVSAVLECGTVFPGQVESFFRKTPVMQTYFREVMRAQEEVFGLPRPAPEGVRVLSVLHGDLNFLHGSTLQPFLDADVYIVFGASYIKGALGEHLVSRGAVNIHMGVSPMYRGSSCNFWALYDQRPHLVGGTVHLLSKGLDSGDILFHALPEAREADPFDLGMLAVRSAIEGLAEHIGQGTLTQLSPVAQDKSGELRYSRGAEFTDEVAEEYLARRPSPERIGRALRGRDLSAFVRPFVFS